MYLTSVKLTRAFFWGALTAGILALLLPEWVPVWVPVSLAIACAGWFSIAVVHVRLTRRRDYRCPKCGWVPFALDAWKCKECGFIWDTFRTGGVCPHCRHEHDETACVRCRRISRHGDWQIPADTHAAG